MSKITNILSTTKNYSKLLIDVTATGASVAVTGYGVAKFISGEKVTGALTAAAGITGVSVTANNLEGRIATISLLHAAKKAAKTREANSQPNDLANETNDNP